MMTENEDYQLIPADHEFEQAWDIRIMKGDFIETVIRFADIRLDGIDNKMHFGFEIIYTPDETLTTENESLQSIVGDILYDIIKTGMEEGTLETKEVEKPQEK